MMLSEMIFPSSVTDIFQNPIGKLIKAEWYMTLFALNEILT